MAKSLTMTVFAAATTAAVLFLAQPTQAATAVLQPHGILLDQADQAATDQVIQVRRGGRGGGWGGRSFGRGGGVMWRRGGSWGGGRWARGGRWAHGGRWARGGRWGRWHGGHWGGRRWVRRGWGWGWGVPAVGFGYYGGACGWGYHWTYRWGCVPNYWGY